MSAASPSILVAAKTQPRIAYSRKPLPQGAPIQLLTHSEFKSKFGCEYTESLFGDRNELAPYLNNEKLHETIRNRPDLPKEQAIAERLNNPLSGLVICEMDESVGCGVFTSNDIPPNTVLFLYAGPIENAKTYQENDAYCYAWIKQEFLSTYQLPLKAISAKNLRGIAGFMQHLPRDEEKHKQYLKEGLLKVFPEELIAARGIDLNKYVDEMMQQHSETDNDELNELKLDVGTKKNLATSNVTFSFTIYKGVPVVVGWTLYGIKAKEQVGTAYGPGYLKNMSPKYFNLLGQVLNLTSPQLPPVSDSSASLPPLDLYRQAVELHRKKEFNAALLLFEKALKRFSQEKGEMSQEVATCYSSAASCYYQLKQVDKAIEYCIQAIHISFILKLNTDKLVEKLKKIIDTEEISPDNIYKKSVELYKSQKYFPAIQLLLTIMDKFIQSKNFTELAYVHSTLSSCYREIGEKESAIQHAKKCLELRKEYNSSDSALLEKAQKKLTELTE